MASRFGAYEILYELKTGGMGAVLLGRRRGPGAFEQLVAIKTILADFAQAPAVRAMFLDEAAILARLNHPGIATVHDFGEQGGILYMVMEYVAGIAFREVMLQGLPPGVAARAIAEACRGVHAAHELRDLAGHLLGVVHRDISPDNLMLGFDGHVKVIDFGIALVKNRQAPVTEFGTVKGKPPYMSPEQVKNEAIDRRSDVFALAVVLWEMLTGRALFEGDSIYAIARAVEHQQLEPPSRVLGAALPAGLDAVVMNALERDPRRRTQTAAAFAEELEQVIQGASGETLEAWAEHALDEPRMAHRAWLARVVAGRDAPRPIGRATGSVTAMAPLVGKAPTLIAPVAADTTARPVTHAVPDDRFDDSLTRRDDGFAGKRDDGFAGKRDDELDVVPRRRLALPLLLGVLVLALVAGGIAVVLSSARSRAVHDAAVADAAVADAAVVDAAVVPVDAAEAPDAAVPVDAPPDGPIDAGRRPVRPPRDAGHTIARDAAPAAAPVVDAAPLGWGRLTAKHKGDRYLNVVLDGRVIGPTPQFNLRIAAGPHVIELIDAKTSEVVVKRTVTVDTGGSVTVAEP